MELSIGSCARFTPNWSGRHACFASQFELIPQQLVQSLFIHDQQHVVCLISANLGSEAATCEIEESRRTDAGWSAPAFFNLAGGSFGAQKLPPARLKKAGALQPASVRRLSSISQVAASEPRLALIRQTTCC